MAGTIVSVFIDPTDIIEATSDGLGLRVVAQRPAGSMGVGDDWVMFIHRDGAVETFDRMIELLQANRARALRRLAQGPDIAGFIPSPF